MMPTLKVTHFQSFNTVSDCPKAKEPEYAFIGRSNVGKSSLINFILGQNIAHTSSKPGKTQLINIIRTNEKWSLVDLPGYGYAKLSKTKRDILAKRTNKYFQKRGIQLVGVFMLIDIRIKPQKSDLIKMEWLTKNNIYFIRTFTKIDGLNKSQIKKTVDQYNKCMIEYGWENMPDTITTSSKKKIGQKDIIKKIRKLNQLFQNF